MTLLPMEKEEPCDSHSLPSSWPGAWHPESRLATLATLTKTFISLLIPSSVSCQAQSPFLPHCGGVDVHFSGATDCFRQIVKAQGVLGLWSGLAANLLKVRRVVRLYYFSASSSSSLFLCRSTYSRHGNVPSNTDGSPRPRSAAWLSSLKREDPVQCWGI